MDAEGKTADEKQKEDTKKDATVMSELQAWKLMMDSMVKFIQASTRLMNTFNSKANSQMSLQSKECEHSLRALLVPTLTALESHRQFKKTKIRPCRSESNSDAEKPIQNIQIEKTDEKCEVTPSKGDTSIKPIGIKLEEAQKEIEALKMEVMRLQHAKSNKVSALYREIMKDSAIDRTLRPSSPKINLANKQQTPISLRKAPVPMGCSTRSINPTEFRKPRSLATTSTIHSEFQIGSLPGDAGISATEAQRRNVPLRIKPRLTNEMVCLRCSKQRRCLQLPQGYESAPTEIYQKMNHHKPYQQPMYPLYPRPVSPSDTIYNSQRALYQTGCTSHGDLGYVCGDQIWQPLHISFEDCGYSKDDNLSYSDEASDEYLCESELY